MADEEEACSASWEFQNITHNTPRAVKMEKFNMADNVFG